MAIGSAISLQSANRRWMLNQSDTWRCRRKLPVNKFSPTNSINNEQRLYLFETVRNWEKGEEEEREDGIKESKDQIHKTNLWRTHQAEIPLKQEMHHGTRIRPNITNVTSVFNVADDIQVIVFHLNLISIHYESLYISLITRIPKYTHTHIHTYIRTHRHARKTQLTTKYRH